jgi:flagellar biosynthetic protein FlhB
MDERDQDKEDKTEDPTDERRRQFREEGKLAATKEILTAISLIFLTILLFFFGTGFVSSMAAVFHSSWQDIAKVTHDKYAFQKSIARAVQPVILPMAAGAVILTIGPMIFGLVLGQFNWSWKKLHFDFNKLNPISGLQNIYFKNLPVETIKTIAKTIIFIAVGYFFVKEEIQHSLQYLQTDVATGLILVGKSLLKIMFYYCIANIIIGASDYAWNLFSMERELRMTKEQLKKEMKTQEGDPLFRSYRRRFGREVLLRSSVEKVPSATFVVTNPTHFSVAVKYSSGMAAPIVVSKGQDYLALRIRQIARDNDIMIIENKMLARALYKAVEIGDEVPSSLYLAVIEIMKAIYQSRGKSYFERYGIAQQFS